MILFDSHAHYDDERFDEDRNTLLNSMQSEGVGTILNCASGIESSKKCIALAKKYDIIYAAVGVHPEEAKSFKDKDLDLLREMTKEKKVVAIGEIGLDYHYTPEEKEIQKAVLKKQLKLAYELDLPAIIHCREADADCFSLVRESKTFGVYHCYSGSVEMMRELLKLGYYISFGGVVTFKNAKRIVDVVRCVPKDRFLIETDCPYLAPEPMRGKRNSSLFLKYTAGKIAGIKGISEDEAASLSTQNAKNLFKIKEG